MYVLRMPKKSLELLLQHSETAYPLEAVALLFGRVTGKTVQVESVRLVDNVATAHETSFLVDPETQYHIMMEEEEHRRVMVCIYHSHPAAPKPSLSDIRNMKLNPVVWLIASKISGKWETNAFILDEEELKPVKVVHEDS